jgi:uncharacterized glyoxalase superfamily protein PhnB
MADAAPLTSQRIFPAIRYVDARAGIAFLGKAFGFEAQVVYDDPSGGVAHAQLVLYGQIVMLGSSTDDGVYPVRSPIEAGAVTAGIYIALDDADAVDRLYERARDAGAEILMPPHDQEYGSHDFMARDPEGHVWSFGTYRPEAPK